MGNYNLPGESLFGIQLTVSFLLSLFLFVSVYMCVTLSNILESMLEKSKLFAFEVFSAVNEKL